MPRPHKRLRTLAALALVVICHGACRQAGSSLAADSSLADLRVGVAAGSEGLRTLAQLLAVENLARLAEDGRPQPWLARGWTLSDDARALSVDLTAGVRFHDGSPLTADIVANALTATLPNTMGPAFSDVESIGATNVGQVTIRMRRASPFLLEALEVPVPKPGSTLIGTGAFAVSNPESPTELRANDAYRLGRPAIDRIVFQTYPSVRAAWAEMLRGQTDMLHEVSGDELDSLLSSNKIATFTFVRRYQFVVLLNHKSDALGSPTVRRALSLAVDRDAVVRDGLNGHGIVSTGPVSPRNHGFRSDLPQFGYDVKQASQVLAAETRGATPLHFTCLIRRDAEIERMALIVKRQLQLVGVEMSIEEAPFDQIGARIKNGKYDAVLTEIISGPTLLRVYRIWHSGGTFGTDMPALDQALDRIRYASSDDQYVDGVKALQQAFVSDPPAIFLAWTERARAVSTRFFVPVEPGRDILATVAQWKPVAIRSAPSQ